MAKNFGKEQVVGSKVQEPKELLTVEEARGEIARVLLDKYNEITKIKKDKTLSEDEKNEEIAKIYDFMDGIYGSREYMLSYVKRFQIKELEKILKVTRDPEKKHDLEKKIRSIKKYKIKTKYKSNWI